MLPRHVVRMMAGDGRRPGAPEDGLHVVVLSAAKVARYRPGPGKAVCVSIRSPGDPQVQLPEFGAVLCLSFADEGLYGALGDSEGLTDEQADQLAEFVVRHHRDAHTLVIHCHAGVSRSRSAAAGICRALRLPFDWTVVNDAVERKVLAALRARLLP